MSVDCLSRDLRWPYSFLRPFVFVQMLLLGRKGYDDAVQVQVTVLGKIRDTGWSEGVCRGGRYGTPRMLCALVERLRCRGYPYHRMMCRSWRAALAAQRATLCLRQRGESRGHIERLLLASLAEDLLILLLGFDEGFLEEVGV